MPTLVTAIRSDRAYVGIGKQSVGGTAIAPTLFPRWLDGSSIMVDIKASDVWEGDGSRRLGSIIKNLQTVKLKLVCQPRPNELGFFEEMAMGAGSDVYTAPTINTTLSALVASGATSISVVANAGLTGVLAIPLVLSAGTARQEIAIFQPPVTGAGPYALAVAASYNGGKLLFAHNSADTVQSPPQHVLTDQTDGNFYSWEVSIGDTAGIIIRVRDCKLETIKRSAKFGDILTYEIEVQGIACIVQASAATVVFDPQGYFLFDQGVWTLDGVTGTAYALAVDSFDITQKNNLDTTIQTEQLTLATIIFGNLGVDVGLSIVYEDGSYVAKVYFGGAGGTADAQAIYQGSLSLTFTLVDTFNSVNYQITTLDYTKADVPQMKKGGKAYRQQVSATSVSNFSQNPFLLQTTVQNTTFAAYN